MLCYVFDVAFRCFYFYSVYVQQLSQWRSCTVSGPGALCLFINWATFFKRLRTAAIKNTLDVFHFDFCYILVTFFIEMVSLSEFSFENPLQKKVY